MNEMIPKEEFSQLEMKAQRLMSDVEGMQNESASLRNDIQMKNDKILSLEEEISKIRSSHENVEVQLEDALKVATNFRS